jgi:hypothetical protein
MVRIAGVIALATGSAAVAGCASSSLVSSSTATHPAPAPISATTSTVSTNRAGYLAALSAEQGKLAATERNLPPRTDSPAALSHSITLLASAITRLAGDLASIRPPAQVAGAHAQLVGIVRSFASQLTRAAGMARQPNTEVAAAKLLIAATRTASGAFAATVAKIDAELGS